MPAQQRQTTDSGLRYDIHFQVVRGKRVPYAYVGPLAYSLQDFSLDDIDRMHPMMIR